MRWFILEKKLIINDVLTSFSSGTKKTYKNCDQNLYRQKKINKIKRVYNKMPNKYLFVSIKETVW